MVRLLPGEDVHKVNAARISFNPTMVRLLQEKQKAYKKVKFAFNPTMVRLLPVIPKGGV